MNGNSFLFIKIDMEIYVLRGFFIDIQTF